MGSKAYLESICSGRYTSDTVKDRLPARIRSDVCCLTSQLVVVDSDIQDTAADVVASLPNH